MVWWAEPSIQGWAILERQFPKVLRVVFANTYGLFPRVVNPRVDKVYPRVWLRCPGLSLKWMFGRQILSKRMLSISKSRQILSKGVSQMSWVVLADNGLLVVASHVVPFHSVSIEVVEDGHASLVALS